MNEQNRNLPHEQAPVEQPSPEQLETSSSAACGKCCAHPELAEPVDYDKVSAPERSDHCARIIRRNASLWSREHHDALVELIDERIAASLDQPK